MMLLLLVMVKMLQSGVCDKKTRVETADYCHYPLSCPELINLLFEPIERILRIYVVI